MSKVGSAGYSSIQLEIRDEKARGVIDKRFQDDYFALDLLKTLYEDTVHQDVKIELLIVLEEYGCYGIEADSVDQIVTSLQDIFYQSMDREDNSAYCCQLLITSTSLLVQLDQLKSDVCSAITKDLVSVVVSRVNQPDSRRLRACACQCLIQMEEFSSGMLEKHRDDFGRLAKQERTDVGQDYMLLLAKVLESVSSLMEVPSSEIEQSAGKKLEGKNLLQKQFSMESVDFRQSVSMIIENNLLYTSCAAWSLTKSLAKLIKTLPEISPMIFRPLLLHHMSSMSSVLFHLVLYIQREFEGEVLNQHEEGELIERLAVLLDHPALTPAQRLLTLQWTKFYRQGENGEPLVPDAFSKRYRMMFYPQVFDPVDCQLGKLYMTALTSDTSGSIDEQTDSAVTGMETSVLLGSLGCLHKLVWHTGRGRAAIALFRALFYIYKHHHSPSFSQDIQKIVQGLISEFPHFIPHAVDFIECIRASTPDSPVYLQTLSLLHQQVVLATEEQIINCYDLYLQVLQKAALEKPLSQAPTLKFLHYLAENAAEIDDSSWCLGHGILSVCRNLLICHGTDFLYMGMGDLLFYIMTKFRDVDVQDKARFYYALLTGASDSKIRSVLQEKLYGASTMTQAISTLLPGKKEDRNLAQILQLDTSVFTWERVAVSAATFHDDLNKIRENKGTVREYMESLQTIRTSVDLKYRLGLTEDCEFDRVHAVSVHVVITGHDSTVNGTHVPCVTKKDCQDVVIQVSPRMPLPHVMNASVTFASDDKKTYCCKLPLLILSFEELLLPLSWQPAESKEFFTGMWTTIMEENSLDRQGIESVIILETDAPTFSTACSSHLSKFILHQTSEDGEQMTRLAMFLPPQYHVLLTCRQMQEQTLVISIATDLGSILPHLHKYIRSQIK